MLITSASAANDTALACPIRPERLIQRLSQLGSTQRISLAHGWSLDMLARSLHHASGSIATLTEKESSLLKQLAQSHPAPMTRETLLTEVWGMQGNIDTHTLETHIYRLRSKLNDLTPSPCDILTQNGAYTLVFAAPSV
jgi:DNA-binding response OmpR family regulator